FKKARVNCEKVDDIVLVRWEKLVWNAPFNPVSVLAGGVNTKIMVENPLLGTLCRNIMSEVCKVAAACGKKLPDDIIEKNIGYTLDFPPYKTSMLLDYENKRPLEVDAILGNTARLAKQHNISVPHIDTLYALLNSINLNG
ncbi:MAG: ketopantoate reductase C-terminal domain-containing protein, partial [Victivallaceae bacterium]